MGDIALRNEEKIGLGAAVLLHGALVGVLAMQTMRQEVTVFPERINVSLTTEVGLEAAAPDPVSESRMASAPTLDINPAPAPEAARSEPATRTAPTPPKPTTKTATQQPAPTRDRSRPDRTAATTPRQTAPKPAGGPSFDEAFRDGAGTSRQTTETRAPAPKYGPSELASLDSAVGRQVKIKWQGRVPQGPDADKLVTRVRFRLNPDGTLAGEPQVLNTVGVTDLNRNQVARHREEAVRAVKLVGQFKVPFPVPADHNTFTLKFERNR